MDPLPKLNDTEMQESERLYLINCAICHGVNLDAQGPMATSGKVGGIANLKLDQYKKLPEGTMFHVATYGKNNMGSYASNLTREQRWRIVQYIRTLEPKTAAASATPAAGKTDSATVVKK